MDRKLFRNYRYYKKMNQVQFAEWLGVSTPTVALFESGHRNLSESTKGKIAHKIDTCDPKFRSYLQRKNNLKGEYLIWRSID